MAGFTGWLGDTIDNVGTFLNLPEFGISEGQAGGRTVNTGRVLPSGNAANSPYLTKAYKQRNPGGSGGSNPALNSGGDTQDSQISDIYSVGTGAGGRSLADIAADRAYLDDQEARLKRQLDSSNAALNNGLTSLQDSYNQELSRSNQERSRALEDFRLKKEDTTRAKTTALDRNDTQARTLADSLRRRIGLASGSGSSAYQLAAPKAVADVASDGRTNVQESFGQNFRNLGLAEKRAEEDFAEQQRDLEAQRKSRESDFRSGILNNQNQIYTSLSEVARNRALLNGGGYDKVREAMAPYSSQIDARQSQLDGLFNQFRTPYNVKAVNVEAPTLKDYVVDRAQISQSASPSTAQDPFSEALRKRRQEETL